MPPHDFAYRPCDRCGAGHRQSESFLFTPRIRRGKVGGHLWADVRPLYGRRRDRSEHVTLVSKQEPPRFEIQLLRYIQPQHLAEANVENLAKPGYNHICFAVTDLDAEVRRLTSQGVALRTEVLDFHARKLVFLSGPEGITVELAEWHP